MILTLATHRWRSENSDQTARIRVFDLHTNQVAHLAVSRRINKNLVKYHIFASLHCCYYSAGLSVKERLSMKRSPDSKNTGEQISEASHLQRKIESAYCIMHHSPITMLSPHLIIILKAYKTSFQIRIF